MNEQQSSPLATFPLPDLATISRLANAFFKTGSAESFAEGDAASLPNVDGQSPTRSTSTAPTRFVPAAGDYPGDNSFSSQNLPTSLAAGSMPALEPSPLQQTMPATIPLPRVHVPLTALSEPINALPASKPHPTYGTAPQFLGGGATDSFFAHIGDVGDIGNVGNLGNVGEHGKIRNTSNVGLLGREGVGAGQPFSGGNAAAENTTPLELQRQLASAGAGTSGTLPNFYFLDAPNTQINPRVNQNTNPNINPDINPDINPNINPNIDPQTDPTKSPYRQAQPTTAQSTTADRQQLADQRLNASSPYKSLTPLGERWHREPQPTIDVLSVRRDFPILQERVNGKQLVWFDNAATTQKPLAVIERLNYFYRHENSNIHRAAHTMAARATDAYENARKTVAQFIGTSAPTEIIFVRGTTEAINLVAFSWGAANINAGDEIILSHLEHHANIVPWQILAQQKGAQIRVIPVDDRGQLLLDEYQKLLNDKTKIVAVTQVSNALGTVTPIAEITAMAHAYGAKVLVDGAQSVAHVPVSVRADDIDFYVFSGHKIYGPTGIGALYAKREILENMPPWQGGGNMIADVTFEKTGYQAPPAKFEAGTGNIADAAGLASALDYVTRIGLPAIAAYEHQLLHYTMAGLSAIPGVRLIGTAENKASVASFVLQGYSTEEVGQALNEEGIAVRTGHHCAQPILRRFGLETTVRPSLAFYNTCEEVDLMLAVLQRLSNKRR